MPHISMATLACKIMFRLIYASAIHDTISGFLKLQASRNLPTGKSGQATPRNNIFLEIPKGELIRDDQPVGLIAVEAKRLWTSITLSSLFSFGKFYAETFVMLVN